MAFGIVGCAVAKYSPEKFFSGQALEVAQAIEADAVERLPDLARGVDLNEPGRKGMTLLWFAIQEKNFDAIRALVELGARPDEQIVQGIGSAVDYAMYSEDLRFLTAMLDGGLPVDLRRNQSKTLLHRAAGAEGATLAHSQLLVERGADVNARTKIHRTPLMEAITTNQPDRAVFLVEQGADVNAFMTNGVSVMWALQSAIETQQPRSQLRREFERLRELMIEKGAKYPPDPPAKVREWAKSQGLKVAE